MGTIMSLGEAVSQLDSLDNESTIYAAEPWTENSKAIVEREPESGGLPRIAQNLGLKYFLEVFVARDFLDGWIANLETEPGDAEKSDRLIQFAINDA